MNKIFLSIITTLFLCSSCSLQPKNENPNGNGNPTESSYELKVGAFNVQVFGRSKMSKPDVVSILVDTISRYDLVLIQEIRNADGTAIQSLLAEVNSKTNNSFSLTIGSRVGRTSSKEQHAFLYKHSLLSVLGTYEIADPNDVFEREPFSVLFQFEKTGEKFIATGIHIKPEDVVNELNALKEAVPVITAHFQDSDIILMGDFNADCSYLSDFEYSNLLFTKDPSFSWQFQKNGSVNDTTVHDTTCTYDQIITSEGLTERVQSYSHEIFNFWEYFNLSKTEALEVSDHFPVGLILEF